MTKGIRDVETAGRRPPGNFHNQITFLLSLHRRRHHFTSIQIISPGTFFATFDCLWLYPKVGVGGGGVVTIIPEIEQLPFIQLGVSPIILLHSSIESLTVFVKELQLNSTFSLVTEMPLLAHGKHSIPTILLGGLFRTTRRRAVYLWTRVRLSIDWPSLSFSWECFAQLFRRAYHLHFFTWSRYSCSIDDGVVVYLCIEKASGVSRVVSRRIVKDRALSERRCLSLIVVWYILGILAIANEALSTYRTL